MKQQQQPGQTMETTAMGESVVVSPLRTEEDAAETTTNPLTDLSILDLKSRKERLQQMIRNMELCDQKKQAPPLPDTVEESATPETVLVDPSSSVKATEDYPTLLVEEEEEEEPLEDAPMEAETAQTESSVMEEEETQVEEASALKKRLQQMIRSMELRDEKKVQAAAPPPPPQPEAVEDSANTQETEASGEESATLECDDQPAAVEVEPSVQDEEPVEEETEAEEASALKKRLQQMIRGMELRDQKKAKVLEQPSSCSIVDKEEEPAPTEELEEPTSSGDGDNQTSVEEHAEPALAVETAAPGEVTPSEPEPEPVAAPVTPESQDDATADQSSALDADEADEAPDSPVVTRSPTLSSLKSAVRKSSQSLAGSVSFATKQPSSSSSSPRKVVFDLSTVQVHQDSQEDSTEFPRAQHGLDEDEDEHEHKHKHDDDDPDDQDELDDEDKYDTVLWEEPVAEDDDEDSIWEEEVIEDDDVVQIAPPPTPPKKSFTVSQPTWEDRQRFVKKLHDLRDEFSITEDNTSVTDDSTISDWRSETSYGSPVSQRYEEQLQQQRQQQPSYRTHSPPPQRPLSPPYARRMSMVSPMRHPLSPEKSPARTPLERRSSMPMTSFLPKKSKLPKLAPTSNVSSTTGKKLPQPMVVSPQTLPSDSASYQTVSLSFLAEDLKDSVAIKVMEEALRILVPGGILYVFDVEGKAVKNLPDELRDLLVRVPYAGVKQTVHEIQTQEIMHSNGYVDLFPREDLIVRWMAVKPKDMVC